MSIQTYSDTSKRFYGFKADVTRQLTSVVIELLPDPPGTGEKRRELQWIGGSPW
jgi:hypothetical protein